MAPHLTLAEQDCLKYWSGSLQTKPCRNPRSIGEEETVARPRGTESDRREEGVEMPDIQARVERDASFVLYQCFSHDGDEKRIPLRIFLKPL